MVKAREHRSWLLIALAICLCLAYTAGVGVYGLRDELLTGRFTGPMEGRVFWEAWRRTEQHFFGNIPSPRTRTYGAIARSLQLLDPYTIFAEPGPRALDQDRLRGTYGGIGVRLWRCIDGSLALAPYPDSPAERAGLISGDVILAVDGDPVSTAVTESAVEVKLRGEIGTQVQLTVRRLPDAPFETTIVREMIERRSVDWHMETTMTGYVQVTAFTQRTGDELTTALRHLREAEAIKLVLDLRQNPGGVLESAVAVGSCFLEPGDILLYQLGRTEQRVFRAQGRGDLTTPLVVLVDKWTASAAEIVAGALQAHDRAVLVGESTFGKGSVQEIYDLSDGSSLHVTTAIWLTPDRHRINGQGLEPDIIVPIGEDTADVALSRAIAYLESE